MDLMDLQRNQSGTRFDFVLSWLKSQKMFGNEGDRSPITDTLGSMYYGSPTPRKPAEGVCSGSGSRLSCR